MTQPTGPSGSPPTATFHARVASVGLITALVVLVAACGTFMLQQWAVARTQSHQMHQSLAEISAVTAAAPLSSGQASDARAVVAALARSKTVMAVRLDGADGRAIASFDRGVALPKDAVDTITKDAEVAGK